ncbi:MAG TPA: histidine phosphatase family protein [Planctomycetota bacterium]
MATRLLMVRHGETVLGAQDRYAGHSDTPLTPRGRRQVAALRRRLPAPDVVYCSDLARCRETAALLVPGREIVVSRRIREIDFGRWEGLTKAQVVEKYGEAYRRWHADPSSGTPYRGESVPDLRRRVRRFAAEVARRHPGKAVLFVTHGGVIRALLDVPFEGYWDLKVPPATLWKVEWR